MGGDRPLASIRVLELGTSIAGPYCCAILAALGAEVVKLEQPGSGDDIRQWGPPFWNDESVAYLSVNAGKRSVAVNLKEPAGVEVVRRLAVGVDVVVQNLRPGLVERLGLGFDALAAENDRLVYCSIGAFGIGPLAERPGYDPLMQAAAGVMSVTGEPGRPPVRCGPSIVDQGTGLWAAVGILAAVRLRDLGAGPQRVDTSLFETALAWLPYQIVGYLATGHVPSSHGSGVSILAPYEAFRTRDGWVMIAAGNDRIFRRLCSALSLTELAEEPRFATNDARVSNRDALSARLARNVEQFESAQLVDLLQAHRIPVAPVNDVGQAVDSEQTAALDILRALPSASVPELRLVAPPVSLDGERLMWRLPPPALGADSVEILRDAGFGDDEVAALLADGIVEHGR
jgi:crotonobetainyl-CoA:carnitine CoA-transferase CaiB-like acyl-CoA transferase